MGGGDWGLEVHKNVVELWTEQGSNETFYCGNVLKAVHIGYACALPNDTVGSSSSTGISNNNGLLAFAATLAGLLLDNP